MGHQSLHISQFLPHLISCFLSEKKNENDHIMKQEIGVKEMELRFGIERKKRT
jgi:hypothetical protein